MKRRIFLRQVAGAAAAINSGALGILWGAEGPGTAVDNGLEAGTRADWLVRWQKNILGEARHRACDRETGEELGWLVSPLLNGFYYGYRATRDSLWLERLFDWTDACLKRAVQEPDGFLGWPKGDGGGGESAEYTADSLLGEAMRLRPVVLAAREILKEPALRATWGAKAKEYVSFAEKIFQKYDSRDCWRAAQPGGLWVVPTFGIDRRTGKWSAGYERRKTAGFSNPDNKENHIARWLLALSDATGKALYRDRAAAWFTLMKSRLKSREQGKYLVWNYWEPAGPWDLKPDGSPRHWVGVRPNGGYYAIDVEGMVSAFEHGLVYTRNDIDRLIATNRDFMWNQQLNGARFQRIDGGTPDPRWMHSPGVLWSALVPYDATLKRIFVTNHTPEDWSGLSSTPWFLALGRE